jgi:hypothetical protein
VVAAERKNGLEQGAGQNSKRVLAAVVGGPATLPKSLRFAARRSLREGNRAASVGMTRDGTKVFVGDKQRRPYNV